ncbi:MAG: hypothetical protein CVV44_09370 [Spirochaetae bacterium HGW-Spirochaetae-1]|jgi:hypothetical protein|nr:MAG: hypothetical protein CVV44_09370 [Spirochaetae bacterium HGW-Spirochaetae-1]
MHKEKWITAGFILAGCVNVAGIPVFSKLFSNQLLMTTDAGAFSIVGLGVIMLWGLAYIAVSVSYSLVPGIIAVFALEKFFYTAFWGRWLWQHGGELNAIYAQDTLTGFFYSIYGVNDFLFGVFFLYVFIYLRKQKQVFP